MRSIVAVVCAGWAGCSGGPPGAGLVGERAGVLLTELDSGATATEPTTPSTTEPTAGPSATGDTGAVPNTADTGGPLVGGGCGDGVASEVLTLRPSPVAVTGDQAWLMELVPESEETPGWVCSVACDQDWLDVSRWSAPVEVVYCPVCSTHIMAEISGPVGPPATCAVELGDGTIYQWTVAAP